MNGWSALDRFLQTDPRDAGCAEATEMLHIYAELMAANGPAEQQYPGHRGAPARVRPVRGGLRRAASPRSAAKHPDCPLAAARPEARPQSVLLRLLRG